MLESDSLSKVLSDMGASDDTKSSFSSDARLSYSLAPKQLVKVPFYRELENKRCRRKWR